MPRVTTSNSRRVNRPDQVVQINGRTSRYVECLATTDVFGLGASTAVLSIPQAFAGDDISFLRDAEVRVFAHDSREPSYRDPVFIGWVDTETAVEDASNSRVTVMARDVRSLLDRVFVGQRDLSAIHHWPHRDRETGLPTGHTLTSILRELFSTDYLPNDWASVLALGTTRGLSNAEADVRLPSILFAAETLQGALRALLAFVPDVIVRARYQSGRTFLDFVLWGSGTAGARRVRACSSSQGPEQGAYLQAYVSQVEYSRTYSRVVGFGRTHRTMLTLSTNHDDSRLVPAWNASDGIYFGDGSEVEYSEGELKVMADPDYATPGTQRFEETDGEHEFVFRRWALPVAIPWWAVEDRNVVRFRNVGTDAADLSYSQLSVQVFKPRRPMAGEGVVQENGDVAFDAIEGEYELIDGAKLEDGFLMLPAPLVVLTAIHPDGTSTFEPDDLYLTITVKDPLNTRLTYDTGLRGEEGHEAFDDEGLVLPVINESLGISRVGTEAGEFDSAAGFGCIYYDPEDQEWKTVAAGGPTVVEDDTEYLISLCERALTERSRRRTMVEAVLPMYWSGFSPTETLRLTGRGIDNKVLTITSISRRLDDPQTVITAHDGRPYTVRLGDKHDGYIAPGAGMTPRVPMANMPAFDDGFNEFNRPMEELDGPIPAGTNPVMNDTVPRALPLPRLGVPTMSSDDSTAGTLRFAAPGNRESIVERMDRRE